MLNRPVSDSQPSFDVVSHGVDLSVEGDKGCVFLSARKFLDKDVEAAVSGYVVSFPRLAGCQAQLSVVVPSPSEYLRVP